jgi:hypothetical protein
LEDHFILGGRDGYISNETGKNAYPSCKNNTLGLLFWSFHEFIDAETKEPLENVLIFQEVRTRSVTPESLEGSENKLPATQTTFSNSKGEYRLPLGAYLKSTLPSTTEISLNFMKLGYFEDGYYSQEKALPEGSFSMIQEMGL